MTTEFGSIFFNYKCWEVGFYKVKSTKNETFLTTIVIIIPKYFVFYLI